MFKPTNLCNNTVQRTLLGCYVVFQKKQKKKLEILTRKFTRRSKEEKTRIGTTLIEAVKTLYQDLTFRVNVGNRISSDFSISKGLSKAVAFLKYYLKYF